MSRFCCELYKKSLFRKHLIDDNCIVGYDDGMSTFFFQSGRTNKDGEPLIWFGTKFFEYKALAEIEDVLRCHQFVLDISEEDREQLDNEHQKLSTGTC